MKYRDRAGNEFIEANSQEKFLEMLYDTSFGRRLLSILVKPGLSSFAGDMLDTKASKCLIPSFIRQNNINMDEYIDTDFESYNDFFTRKIKQSARPFDMAPDVLCSPCDAKLSVYPINEDSVFSIKNSVYSLEKLFDSQKVAKRFVGGTLLMFRLTVDDYHRYCFPDGGEKSGYRRIPGVFHTVNPLANEKYPIYTKNTREYCLIRTDNFGTILMMEVGAMLVGKIANYSGKKFVKRGEEKGRFEFGGSTIIICLEKDKALIDADILANTSEDFETRVKMGERIGMKL